MAWEEWIQGASNTLLGAYVQDRSAKRDASAELAKLQLQALGPGGYYTEGRAGTSVQPKGDANGGLWMLLGGVVLLVVLMRDD